MGRTKITDEQLIEMVPKSKSWANLSHNLGFSSNEVKKQIREKINKLGLDTSHFNSKWFYGLHDYKNKKPPEEILKIKVSKGRMGTHRLRRALVESGIEEKCAECGLNEWRHQKIRLDVHHLDGNIYNNTKENLQLLCPNCHRLENSKTTWNKTVKVYFCVCGKEKHKDANQCQDCHLKQMKRKPSGIPQKEVLEKLLWEMPMNRIAEKLGVCQETIYNWTKVYNLNRPGRKYWPKLLNKRP